MSTGGTKGPLSHVVSYEAARNASGVHAVTVDILLVLVAFHVAAVGFHWLYKRDNLILPMVTGRKRLPAERDAPRLAPDLLRPCRTRRCGFSRARSAVARRIAVQWSSARKTE